MKSTKFIHAIIAIVAITIFESNSFAAKKIDTAKENLSELQTKIEALKLELDNNQKAHVDASDALKNSETAISNANQKLAEINKKQKQNKIALNTLSKQSLTLN